MITVIPTLHPAAILRGAEGDRSEARFKLTCVSDFKKAKYYLTNKWGWDESVIWERDESGRLKNLFPTLQEALEFLKSVWKTRVSIDLEATDESPLVCKILVIGAASSNGKALCIPILNPNGFPYWTPDQWVQLKPYLAFILSNKETVKITQNGVSFDGVVLWANGLPIAGPQEDTLQKHHVCEGELPHGLAYLGSVATEVPYYKDEVKGDSSWLAMDRTQLHSYNLRDCLVTLRAEPVLDAEVNRLGLRKLYENEIANCQVMARATIRGLLVDQERKLELGDKLRKARDTALASLRELAGDENFNPDSMPQRLKFLFGSRMKFPVVKLTKRKNPSTDKEAMVLLSLHADKEEQRRALRDFVSYRKNSKFLNTWVDGLPVLADGRLHPTWKLTPVTGRFASSPNAQNFNRWVKRIFTCPEGHEFVSVDLSQAELRGTSYFTGDEELLRMYEEGINIHTANVALLFQIRCPVECSSDANPQTIVYLREACQKFLGKAYDSFPTVPKSKWKTIRVLAKVNAFSKIYGAKPETQFAQARSKRDPESDELLFANLTLSEVEAFGLLWDRLHPRIAKWQDEIVSEVRRKGYYQCPYSGRIRFFRAGMKRNEILDMPNQMLVAGWMNASLPSIDGELSELTNGRAQIVLQVHDSITVETPIEFSERVGQILFNHFKDPRPIHGIASQALLPAEVPTRGKYLDEV